MKSSDVPAITAGHMTRVSYSERAPLGGEADEVVSAVAPVVVAFCVRRLDISGRFRDRCKIHTSL